MAVQNYFQGMEPLGAGMGNAMQSIALLKQRDRALAADEQQNALLQQREQRFADAETQQNEMEQTKALAGMIYEGVKAKEPRAIEASIQILGKVAPMDPQAAEMFRQNPDRLAPALERVFGIQGPPDPLEVQNLPGYGVAVTQGGQFKASRANPAPQQYAPETFSTELDDQGNILLVGSRGTIRETGRKGKATPNPEDTKAQVERAKAEQAWSMYETAMTGLQGAMNGTVTGPVFGRVPAFSAGQQTADGAVAAMAPILKQLFRTAGEGTFTDKDQALLLQMVPTRADRAEARDAKIANINAIVRAKLGLEPTSTGGSGGLSPEEQAELEELRKRFKGR